MAETLVRPVALAIGGLLALASAMGVGRFVYTPILPVMVEALGLTQAQAGLIASSNFAGYLAGALATAAPRLPGSRRAWLLGALVASALTTGAMGLTTSLPAFLALRFVGGVASAFCLVFASALVLDRLAQADRAGLSALYFAGVGIGIAASAVILAGLVAGGASWRILWFAGGAASLAAVPLVALLIPAEDGRTRKSAAPERKASPGLRRLIAAYGLFGFGYVITATFIAAVARSTPALAPLEPYVWIAVGLAAAPSVALWNRAGARIGVFGAFALACAIEAFGVALSVLAASPVAILFAAGLLGGTFMGITALGLVGARRLAAADARRTLALMTAAFGLGQIVGPTFAGLAHGLTGSFALPSMVAAGALAAASLLTLSAATVRERRAA